MYSDLPIQARKLAIGLSAVIGLLVAAGCAVVEKAAIEDSKRLVAERANERWDLLMKGRLDLAYEFYSPSSRQQVSLELFRRRSAAARFWRATRLEKVECQAEACKVTMALEYDLREFKGLKAQVEEAWVKDSGNWWLVAPRR